MRHLRTITAKVTSAEDGLITFKVTQVDDRINPTALAVGDEPLVTNRIVYVPVYDTGAQHPTFDFYSPKEGKLKLYVEAEIVLLCEDKDGEIIYLYWTTKADYSICQKKIRARIEGRKVQSIPAPKQVVADTRHYRLTHDNQRFTGTIPIIQTNLYRYNGESQVDGWPEDCSWELHTGRCFQPCSAPTHPGPNRMLEPKTQFVVT